ncbi:hypothetical protein D3C87_1846650 [compost metagenome]
MGVHQRFEHAVAALHHLSARRFEVRHDHYRDPCGLRRACAVLAVFKRQALCGVHAQAHSRQLVQGGVGFAARHLVAASPGVKVLQHAHPAQAVLDLVAPRR